MVKRLIALCLIFGYSGYTGGLWGLYVGLLIVGLFGALFPYRPKQREESSDVDDKRWEKVEPARRGSSVDPTRPDDHPLMLTNEIRRRK